MQSVIPGLTKPAPYLIRGNPVISIVSELRPFGMLTVLSLSKDFRRSDGIGTFYEAIKIEFIK